LLLLICPFFAFQAVENTDLEESLDDTMNSPLNPDAPPFIPVSPSHGTPEISSILSNLINEEVVSQSPQKPVPMDDIDVPEPSVFQNEVSSRLHDFGNDNDNEYMNGHSNDSVNICIYLLGIFFLYHDL